MRLTATLTTAALALSACAQSPSQIVAAPVPTAVYSGMSCAQLRAEAASLNQQVTALTGAQQQKAANDAAMMAVGMLVFWPALFAVGAGGDVSPQLAQAKGQADAINRAAIQRGC